MGRSRPATLRCYPPETQTAGSQEDPAASRRRDQSPAKAKTPTASKERTPSWLKQPPGGGSPSAASCTLLHLDLGRTRRLVPPTIGTLEPHPQGTLLRTGVDSPEWGVRYLVGLDVSFTVLGPPEAKSALAVLGRELIAFAGGMDAGQAVVSADSCEGDS